MPITIKVMSLNPTHDEMSSVQHYVINLRQQDVGFPQVLWNTFANKTDCHDITEILLNVVLNTIIGLTLNPVFDR